MPNKLIEVVLHVGKGDRFGIKKVNGDQKYAAETLVLEMGRILKNNLSSLRVNYLRVILSFVQIVLLTFSFFG